MTIKIIKLIIIFIACIPFYILIDFISCMLITEGFSVENAFRNSTAFAVTWTGIIGYKWFKKEKTQRTFIDIDDIEGSFRFYT